MSSKRNNQPEGINLGEIYYVIFRRKWVIVSAFVCAVIAAGAVFVLIPAQFQSEAKLLIRYVTDQTMNTTSADLSVKSPEHGDTIMDTENQTLMSLDLIQQVVQDVGASNILAKAGGGDDTNAAAHLVLKDLTIDPLSRGSIIHITFQNPDAAVAQSVLREVIRNYYKKHAQMHQAVGVYGDFLTTETKRLRSELSDTERLLREAKNRAGVISLTDAQKSASEQMTKVKEDLMDAEAELAEHRAILNSSPAAPRVATNATEVTSLALVPAGKLRDYKNMCVRLSQDMKTQDDYLNIQRYRPDSVFVLEISDRITKEQEAKEKFEEQYPALLSLSIAAAPAAPNSAPPPGMDLAAEAARVRMLEGKTNRLHMQLDQIRSEEAKLEEVEAPIEELQHQKELKEGSLNRFLTSLEQIHIDEELGLGKGSGEISVVENPTPPEKKRPKSFKKFLGMAAAGCLGAGFAIAFLLEIVFDHTVRRPSEVGRKLRLPLFVSIPRIEPDVLNSPLLENGKSTLLLGETNGSSEGGEEPAPAGANGSAVMPPWDRTHPLHRFYAGLRERLIVNFEVRNLTHNPKLVAVTGCGRGSGVSSIAAGLAASLSETGDGNVLLVDMNMEQHTAQQFYKGRPDCGLDAALEEETRATAMVSENLYVASEITENEKLPRILSKRFAALVPKLKASDYDYIIFDMPAVSQTSVTPRLAGLMDMVLLVLESEKTTREAALHAASLLAESKAVVNAVLNKTHNYVPRALHHDFHSEP